MRRTKICTRSLPLMLTANLEITNVFYQVRYSNPPTRLEINIEFPGRNYAVIREYVEDETLSPSETEPVKRSTFSKIRRSTFKRSQKADLTLNKTVAGLDGANLSTSRNGHQREALDVVLKMEVNQHDPSGATKPYRLVVPALKCERAAADGDSWSHDGGWI